jgi:hypothetical protein
VGSAIVAVVSKPVVDAYINYRSVLPIHTGVPDVKVSAKAVVSDYGDSSSHAGSSGAPLNFMVHDSARQC